MDGANARQYELVYVLQPQLDESGVNSFDGRVCDVITAQGGSDIATEVWGKRTLAYPIKKKETGYYVVANFQAEPAQLPEFERAIKLDDGVLRHLVVVDEFDYTPSRAPTDRKFEEDDE